MLWPLSWDDDNWRSMFHTILEGYFTMLWPLSWDDDYWQTMFHTSGIYNHVLTVVVRRWQLTEHVSYLTNTLPCSDRCHETMTADRACFILEGGITLLWPLSLDDDNWQSLLHILGMNNNALSVVMRRWKLTEHVSYTSEILPCSDRCHKTMTTDGAFFILEGYFNILWPLSWDDDNWRSMFHTWGIFHHALTVVMRRWQLTEHVSYLRDD